MIECDDQYEGIHGTGCQMSIYPISEQELDVAAAALDNAINGGASLGSCVHAVLGAIEKERNDNNLRLPDEKLGDLGRQSGSAGYFVPPLWLRKTVKRARRK
jgi:hypothetical protein